MDTVIVIERSFTITNRGIIAFLRHTLQGLPPGTKLRSTTNGQVWVVESRVMYNHLLEQHYFFANEAINYMTLSFSDTAKLEASTVRTQQEEKRGVYQYFLRGVENEQKLSGGDKLELVE